MILCEDFEYRIEYNEWSQLIQEFIDRDVSYMPLGRLWKYTREEYISGYRNGEKLYYYDAKDSPPTRVSGTGIFDREWYVEILTDFMENRDKYMDSIPYGYPELPNCLEGYLDYERGIQKFGNMKCGIPKKDIFVHWDAVTQQAEYVNKNTGQKKGNARDHNNYWAR